MYTTLSDLSYVINSHPVLPAKKQVDLFKDWKENKNKKSLDTLILSNLRIVSREAYKALARNKSLHYEDLFQEGVAGLMKATEKFDEDNGTTFLTYAMWWVRAYIKKYVMDQKSLVRMGKSEGERAVFSGLRKAEILADKNGWCGNARIKNIANILNVKEKTLSDMKIRLSASDQSLDAPIKNDGESALRVSMLRDDSSLDEDSMATKLQYGNAMLAINDILETLSYKEKIVIKHRFLSRETLSLREVGEILSLTKEGVRLIEKKALLKIKKSLSKTYGIKDFFII